MEGEIKNSNNPQTSQKSKFSPVRGVATPSERLVTCNVIVKFSFVCLFFLVGGLSPTSAADLPIPEGGAELLRIPAMPSISVPVEVGSARMMEVKGAPDNPVLRAELTALPKVPWRAYAYLPLGESIMKGDACLLTFHMRAPAEGGVPVKAIIGANVQLNPSTQKTLEHRFRPGPNWEEVRLPFRAEFDIPQGRGIVNLVLGFGAQTVEICGLSLLNYGQSFDFTKLPRAPRETYEGREPNAAWRKAAEERIEQHRKSELKITVVDENGRPVPNAEVRVELKRHAFGFGSAVTANGIFDLSSDARKYQQIVDENFSRVVLENDLKYMNFTGLADEKKRRAHHLRVMEALGWLRAKDLPVRGHFLAWCYTQPWNEALYKARDLAGLRAQIYTHMDSVFEATGGRMAEWDAINHPIAFDQNLSDLAGGPFIYAEIMTEARKRTKLPLFINEDLLFDRSRQDRYYEVVKDLIARDAKPDGIGNMAHFRSDNLPGISDWLSMSDRFAALVPNLAVTEYDLETDDDALHADYLRDLLTATFSHPAYSQFIMWGFWEGAHWRPRAALWRKDWSEKPGAKVWRELVKGRWHSRAEGKADLDGNHGFRAFHGLYEVTAISGDRRATLKVILPKGGAQCKVMLEGRK